MRDIDIVDHDVEWGRRALAHRLVATGHDKMRAAAQFKDAEVIVAEDAPQAKRLEEIDGVGHRVGFNPDMADRDGWAVVFRFLRFLWFLQSGHDDTLGWGEIA